MFCCIVSFNTVERKGGGGREKRKGRKEVLASG
jgi:hypothetical protein